MVNPYEVIDRRLSAIEQVLQELRQQRDNHITPATDENNPLNVEQAAEFLGVSRQTIYQNIARLPKRKRFGRLYFFRSELAEYLNAGKGIGA